MQHCSPTVEAMAVSCYTFNELKEIAKAYNSFIAENKKLCKKDGMCIINPKPIETAINSKAELWQEIYKKLNALCKSEYCWIDLSFIKSIPDPQLQQKLKDFTFKPQMTKTRYTWLSTNDINNVMKQYSKLSRAFYYIGALPSDFYKYTSIDTTLMYKYSLLAIIFNLDAHHQQGSHWVSLVIDNNIQSIEYFDSIGDPPNQNIKQFISLLRMYLPGHVVRINKIKHQYKNSECGTYSMFYIIQRLLGSTFEKLTQHVIKDKSMNKFRDRVFRPKN